MKVAVLFIHTLAQLRYCLAFLLFAVIPYNSFAVDVCVSDDTVAVVVKGQSTNIGPTAEGQGGVVWKSTNSNGDIVIQGTSACLNSLHGVTQWEVYTENNGVIIENNAVVVGGERNGKYCFCKITYPVVSLWVNRDPAVWASESVCASNCAYWCVQFTYGSSPMLKPLLNTIDY